MAEDAASLSRRIDELLSGAIDEQVREQRAINELMVSVRDGISRLVGDMAALSARVTESRETSQGLREELPFLVQNEVTAATNNLAQRIDVLESAIGELAGGQTQLENKLAPDLIVGGVAAKVNELRAAAEETAGAGAAEAAREAVDAAAADMKAAFEDAAASLREAVDKQFSQIARRLADAKTQADELDERIGELSGALATTARLPGDMNDTVGRLTAEVSRQTTTVVEQVREAAADAADQLQQTVGGIERASNEANKRFSEMSARLASFQEQILAYLQVRDVALEEKRDQIVSEILDDYLRTVPSKERTGTVERMREAFRRRRDRKDAAKYRDSGTAPSLPQVPREAVDRAVADLVRETEAAPRPAPPSRPSASAVPVAAEPAVASTEVAAAFGVAEPEPLKLEPEAAPKSRRASTAARKAAPKRASKPAPKKKSPQTEKPAPAPEAMPEAEAPPVGSVEGGPAEEVSPLDISGVDTLDEDAGPIEAEAAASIAADLLGGTRDEPASEAEKPKAKKPATKSAKPKKKKEAAPASEWEAPAGEEWEPVEVEPEPEAVPLEAELAAEAEPTPASEASEEPSPAPPLRPAPPKDDTLALALARVEALVAQHRDPAKRKPAAKKPPRKSE